MMNKIILLSCTSKKLNYKCKAKDMYSKSPIFSRAYKYAKMTGDRVLILSAKYGVLNENDLIEPYDLTLNNQSIAYRKEWSTMVLSQLNNTVDISKDYFTILTGKSYYEYLITEIKNYEIPLRGKSLGFWIPSLDNLIDNYNKPIKAHEIHRLFSSLQKYDYSSISQIPFKNGIYVMFDKYEIFEDYYRIVRIGTHTGQNNLISRLNSHFRSKNQRSSIFRKNIGRCFLNERMNPYLKNWNFDRTNELVDREFEKQIENEITEYLKKHIVFICFPVEEKSLRLRLEDGIISSLNKDDNFNASKGWLGNNSSIADIKKSGLWCVHGLKKEPLNNKEFNTIKTLINGEKYEKSDIEKISVIKNTKKNISRKKKGRNESKVENVRLFIMNKISKANDNGSEYLDIISGEIHKELNLKNSMPTVCNAMYKLMSTKDEILHTTKSGFSSTIRIRYYK